MDSWISLLFILQLHPFSASVIRVFSTSTDPQGWSNQTKGCFAGASLIPESLPDPFSSFYEFAITNGYLVSSVLKPEEANGENQLKNVYIFKVDNRPRTDGLSRYLEGSSTKPVLQNPLATEEIDFIDSDLIKGDEYFPPVTLKNLKIMSRYKDGHSGIFRDDDGCEYMGHGP